MKLAAGTPCLTAAQMRRLEAFAMQSGEVTGAELMERAARGVTQAILRRVPEGRRAIVLCGPGNNGGDGYVIARMLAEAEWEVTVLALAPDKDMPEDADAARVAWRSRGDVVPLTTRRIADLPQADIIVDALFGIGLSRQLSEDLAKAAELIAKRSERVIAVDVPSGLDADTGRAAGGGAVLCADLTVTFDSPKLGHFLADGPASCGALEVVDIGLAPFHAEAFANATPPHLQPCYDGNDFLPPARRHEEAHMLRKKPGHKYDHGAALILSGGVGKGGAARMAARAALRMGAGLVTLGCPPAALIENAAQLDAIMLTRIPDADALTKMLEEDDRISALGLGPGLGTGAREAELLRAALAADRATVLDADALTLLSQDNDCMAALHDNCLLTPHGGEFARMFPDLADRMKDPQAPCSKVDAVREAAARCGATVLLKGPDTVIATPDGGTAIASSSYSRSAPWLGTAGAGDVLTGITTGLMARGVSPFDAARAGAVIHVDAALAFGPGLIAEDLPDLLPGALQALPL